MELSKSLLENNCTYLDNKFHHINEHLLESGLNLNRTKADYRILLKMLSMELADYEVVHFSYYSRNFFNKFYESFSGRTISTIYDMIPEKFPEYFPKSNPHVNKDFYIENSTACVAISNTTFSEAFDYYGASLPPVTVIPVPLSSSFSHFKVKRKSDNPGVLNYFLFVGNRSLYKNFQVILYAFAKNCDLSKFKLICIGPQPSSEEVSLICQLRLDTRVLFLSSSDSNMPDYYAGALGTITSSVHEGFNMPIIESLACGTPVIASDIKVHREFESDSIYYFHPMSHVDLGDTLIRVLNNYERIAESTFLNSLEIKSKYSIKKIVNSYITLYERTINGL